MLEQPSKRDAMRGLMQMLRDNELTEYGADIPAALVHKELEIEIPSYAAKAVYDRLAMLELAAIDYCRNVLLGEGKYLAGTRTGYRILLPSENKGQVDSYMQSADKKLARALKLSRNSVADAVVHDQTEARIMLKRTESRRQYVPQQIAA